MFPDFQQKKLKIKRFSAVPNNQTKIRDQKNNERIQTAFEHANKNLNINKKSHQTIKTTLNQIPGFRKSVMKQGENKESKLKISIVNQRKSLKRLSKTHQKSSFYYFIKGEGNNSTRVQQILNLRGCWQRTLSRNPQSQINFYWNMSSSNNANSNKFEFSLFSRISGAYELTDKARLYDNIVRYCQKYNISNELFLPITFCFTSKQSHSELQQNIDQFLDYFSYIKDHTNLTNSWIFKPTNLNRGRDIFLFNTLQKLFQLIYTGQGSFQVKKQQKSQNKFLLINKYKKYKSTHELQKKSLSKYIAQKAQKEDNEIQSLQLLRQNSMKKKSILNKNQNLMIFQQLKHQQNTEKTIKLNPFNHKARKTLEIESNKMSHLTASNIKGCKLKTQSFSEFQELKQRKMQHLNPKAEKNRIELSLNPRTSITSKIEEVQPLRLRIINAIKQLSGGKGSIYSQDKRKQIIIQKYIQNPYLIKQNKFDIRIWVLVDQQMNIYVFKSGYLRFSSHKYRLDDKSIENNFIHLTNHAIQKYSNKYEKEVNIVSMLTLKEHLQKLCRQQDKDFNSQTKKDKYDEIWNEIERIIIISLEATIGQFYRKEYNQNKHTIGCQFQIFGYDFLLDRELKVRLIQSNCNPSITQDNKYLEQAVPRMLNDAFKLTVDRDFLPTKTTKSSFYMHGFSNQNMWKRIGKIGSTNVKDIKHSFQ